MLESRAFSSQMKVWTDPCCYISQTPTDAIMSYGIRSGKVKRMRTIKLSRQAYDVVRKVIWKEKSQATHPRHTCGLLREPRGIRSNYLHQVQMQMRIALEPTVSLVVNGVTAHRAG